MRSICIFISFALFGSTAMATEKAPPAKERTVVVQESLIEISGLRYQMLEHNKRYLLIRDLQPLDKARPYCSAVPPPHGKEESARRLTEPKPISYDFARLNELFARCVKVQDWRDFTFATSVDVGKNQSIEGDPEQGAIQYKIKF